MPSRNTVNITVVPRPNQVKPAPQSTNTENIYSEISPKLTTLSAVSTFSNRSSPKSAKTKTNTQNQDLLSPATQSHPNSEPATSNQSSLNTANAASTANNSSVSKPFVVAIVVSILFSLGVLCAGIILILRATTSTTVTTVSTTTLTLRWNPVGSTVAGNGIAGSTANQLNTPQKIAFDSSDALYIAELSHRVQKWVIGQAAGTTAAGQPNGSPGSAVNQLNNPYGVCVDLNNNIYVADTTNHRIQLWTNGSTSGRTVAGVNGSPGAGYHQLTNPRGVAVDRSTGTIYIADTGNHRIMSYAVNATNGTLAAGGNGPGSLSNQLYQPYAVYFDSSSNSLFIVGYYMHAVVQWPLGGFYWTLVAGNIGASGSTALAFSSPIDITFDSMGNMYVCDYNNHRIQFFSRGQLNGTTIAGTTGVAGSSTSLLYNPTGIALDAQLNLYVSDSNNDRIQRFERY